jgi:hypothetical protein
VWNGKRDVVEYGYKRFACRFTSLFKLLWQKEEKGIKINCKKGLEEKKHLNKVSTLTQHLINHLLSDHRRLMEST